jgi:decaprenylphospho-beta-D-erythro-pentofuranosid-2-ulose 2-reductase
VNDAFANPQTALVLGGGSEIAHAAITRLAAGGLQRVVLACRRPEAVEAALREHPLPVAEVTVLAWDARDVGGHAALMEEAGRRLGDIDLVLCAVGSLGHHAGIDATPEQAADIFTDNYTGPAAACTAAAHHLGAQGHGSIVVLSSVAGIRPRKSNYLYGSAKAGLDAFAQGLADAVLGTGVHVHVIRPGFVTTKMTDGLEPAPFATTATAVADAIADAVTSTGNRIIHVPALLGPMFGVLRNAPRPVWRRIAGDR